VGTSVGLFQENRKNVRDQITALKNSEKEKKTAEKRDNKSERGILRPEWNQLEGEKASRTGWEKNHQSDKTSAKQDFN